MKRTLAVFVPLLLAGYAVTFGGYVWMNSHFPGQYNYLEIVWWMCGINVLMQTVSVFAIMHRCLAGRSLPGAEEIGEGEILRRIRVLYPFAPLMGIV